MSLEQTITKLNAFLETIEALNVSIDILTQWQDDALEVDPEIHNKIMLLRESKL